MTVLLENPVAGRYGPYVQFVTAGRHVMGADKPEVFGGRDKGPSPYEYTAAGLGAGPAMTLRICTGNHQWSMENISPTVQDAKVEAAEASLALSSLVDVPVAIPA